MRAYVLKKAPVLVMVFVMGLWVIGCAHREPCPKVEPPLVRLMDAENKRVEQATAVISPLGKNKKISGVAQFTKNGGDTHVVVTLKGLKPHSRQGLHIHEFGDCRASDGSSAGPHFNPHQTPHGGPEDGVHHAGDLGNIVSDKNGEGQLVLHLVGVPLHSLIGRSLVLHGQEDDLKSQPAGNSGGRVGCGPIFLGKTIP